MNDTGTFLEFQQDSYGKIFLASFLFLTVSSEQLKKQIPQNDPDANERIIFHQSDQAKSPETKALWKFHHRNQSAN